MSQNFFKSCWLQCQNLSRNKQTEYKNLVHKSLFKSGWLQRQNFLRKKDQRNTKIGKKRFEVAMLVKLSQNRIKLTHNAKSNKKSGSHMNAQVNGQMFNVNL